MILPLPQIVQYQMVGQLMHNELEMLRKKQPCPVLLSTIPAFVWRT